MANEPLDPLTLESWEDAFLQPIPVVRKLEQQLRRHADENRDKLRNLVGVSYRDLLDTAERIIDMDNQMHNAEVMLGQTGQRCNSKAVSRTSSRYGKVEADNAKRFRDRYTLASQLTILENCTVIITRILKRKGSLSQAAKLLLLSRLTHKTLSQRPEAPPLVDSLKGRLASLRNRLLRAIDKHFADPDRDTTKLVDDMCAFSLATNSTPTDVLQHFLKVRLRAMQWHLAQGDDIEFHSIRTVHLLLSTLRNGQVIFPKRLSDSLVRLKDLPLIKQADVQSVTELQLGVHARWLTDELRNYTPWPRHDELQKTESEKIIKSWARAAQNTFTTGLTKALNNVQDFDDILRIRQKLFEAWPWADSRLPGLHSADVVDELRETFNDRMTAVTEMQVGALSVVCASTRRFVQTPNAIAAQPSLWSSSLMQIDTGAGGQKFKSAILSSYIGIETSDCPPLLAFDNWIANIEQIQTSLKQMRDTHWEDELGDDENEMDSRQTLLSEDDSRVISSCLDSAIKKQSNMLLEEFQTLAQEVVANKVDHNPSVAVALLKITRELFKQASAHEKRIADVALPLTTSQALAQTLHKTISEVVSTKAESSLSNSFVRLQKSQTLVGRTLWEGKPPLPVQPSPMAFKFLKAVSVCMAECGSDLWAVASVIVLKDTLCIMVEKHVKAALVELYKVHRAIATAEPDNADGKGSNQDNTEIITEEDKSNGTTEETNNSDPNFEQPQQDKITQLVLDMAYLSSALSTKSSASTPLSTLIKEAALHIKLDENVFVVCVAEPGTVTYQRENDLKRQVWMGDLPTNVQAAFKTEGLEVWFGWKFVGHNSLG